MKIIFLTQDDPVYLLPFFDEFFKNYHDRFDVVGVFCSRPMGQRKRLQLLHELLSLYGFSGFFRLIWRIAFGKLLAIFPVSKQSRNYHSIGKLCRAFDVPCLRITNPNDAALASSVQRSQVDLIVSVACPYILKDSILRAPLRGCVNIHHALLPNYKGMMPTFWQMFHGEHSVGLTIHYMTPKVDEGAALLQELLEIHPDETLDHLIRRSKRHGAHCMARVLGEIANGIEKPTALDNSKGSYFTFPTIAEIREFRYKGLKAI
jgi:methionyl-tRNA formyltransferase